jgi:hypothetical protein
MPKKKTHRVVYSTLPTTKKLGRALWCSEEIAFVAYRFLLTEIRVSLLNIDVIELLFHSP